MGEGWLRAWGFTVLGSGFWPGGVVTFRVHFRRLGLVEGVRGCAGR